MNSSAFSSLHPKYQRIDIIRQINKFVVDRGDAIKTFIGTTTETTHSGYIPLKEKPVLFTEKQRTPDDHEFIFVKDTDDFVVQIKQIITRNLNSSDEFKIIAAHNLDFFLTTYNCFNASKVKQVNWNRLFSAYQASKELQYSASMIHLDCLFIRFEAHFKERYREFECKFKSEDSQNCILCTLNWYTI